MRWPQWKAQLPCLFSGGALGLELAADDCTVDAGQLRDMPLPCEALSYCGVAFDDIQFSLTSL